MISDYERLRDEAAKLVAFFAERGLKIASAESCTGGLVAALITEIPGSSAVFERGFVTYSNTAKETVLEVSAAFIEAYGAVSKPVVEAMANGALAASEADIAVAITGIAGPGGGSTEKPVGLVHFAAATSGSILHHEARFGDVGRSAVRFASAAQAFAMLREAAART